MRSHTLSVLLITVMLISGLVVPFVEAEQPQTLDQINPASSPVESVGASRNELSMEALLRVTSVPERDLHDLAVRLKRAPSGAARVAKVDAPALGVGAQQSFWVANQAEHGYFQASATLRYVTSHLYMWVENGYNVSDEAIARSAERFENHVYPVTHQFFGKEWAPGVDGDVHISVFNGHVPGVGGYYSSADEFCQVVNQFSNERELFYINLDNALPGTDQYDGILAHEFQHMIHWNSDRNEQTWVNEGMSELSAQVSGLNTSGSMSSFVNRPDTQLTGWADQPSAAAPNYGAAHSFMNYLLKRFGESLIRGFVGQKDNGFSALDEVLKAETRGVTADEVFGDWVVANYLGNQNVGDGRYGPRVVDAPMALDVTHDAYPAERSATVSQYGTDYIELKGSGDVQIEFAGAQRVKLTNNDAHSGAYQWWSNRGDDSDMTLTREFDLTGVPAASLNFWMWYDIEKDWDYAYVAASVDGGATWDIVSGSNAGNGNANGNAFGSAYTGYSGGGAQPVWVQERIDLSPYIGRRVQIRFEYVTDDAVNHSGFSVDDISVPELGYADDAESDAGGWDAKGFVRSDNLIPQRFLVQLIEFGEQIRVRRFAADSADLQYAAAPQPVAPAVVSAPAELSEEVRAKLLSVEHSDYEVQPRDNLWKIAERFLGDGSASQLLVAATNVHHEQDSSYPRIDDPRSLRSGWRICVPTTEEAKQELLSLKEQVCVAASGSAPAVAAVPASVNGDPRALPLIGGPQKMVVRGLGGSIQRAVLVVSAIAPVTTEVAPYTYRISQAQ